MSFATKKAPCTGIESRPGCIQTALKILGDKWSPLLIGQLVAGEKSFGELELTLAGISPRTLSARLEKLTADGVLQKKQYCQHPPRYKYDLTNKGKGLLDILEKMAVWGDRYS
jgi:DNA-binding HxlR family transcriptional regulator